MFVLPYVMGRGGTSRIGLGRLKWEGEGSQWAFWAVEPPEFHSYPRTGAPCFGAFVSPSVNRHWLDKEVSSGFLTLGEEAWFSYGTTSGFQGLFLEEGCQVGWNIFCGLEVKSPRLSVQRMTSSQALSSQILGCRRDTVLCGPFSAGKLCGLQSQHRNPGSWSSDHGGGWAPLIFP